VDVCKTWSRSS